MDKDSGIYGSHRPPPEIEIERVLRPDEVSSIPRPPPRRPPRNRLFRAGLIFFIAAAGLSYYLFFRNPPEPDSATRHISEKPAGAVPASVKTPPMSGGLPAAVDIKAMAGRADAARIGALRFVIEAPVYAEPYLDDLVKQVWIRSMSIRKADEEEGGWHNIREFPWLATNLPAGSAEVALKLEGYKIGNPARRVLIPVAATTEVSFTATPLPARLTVIANVSDSFMSIKPDEDGEELVLTSDARNRASVAVPALRQLSLTVSATGFLSQVINVPGVIPGSNMVREVDLLPIPPLAPKPARTSRHKPGRELGLKLGEGVELELVWVPAGGFLMGSPENELGRYADEGPQHLVEISRGFWMGKYEVTQTQWELLMDENPSRFNNPSHPVEQVSWQDCRDFTTEINSLDLSFDGQKLTFDLPSEAEWEYACRAGTATALNNGANLTTLTGRCPRLNSVAWFISNSEETVHPVGRKRTNEWGLHDMHGNVWEWCRDSKRSYEAVTVSDPEGAGDLRVSRGGSCSDYARFCRSATRYAMVPLDKAFYLGFRVIAR